MRRRISILFAVGFAATGLLAAGWLWSADDPHQALARSILDETGVRGGIVVHLGCGDGRLTAALKPGEDSIVHGLDANARNVARAREHETDGEKVFVYEVMAPGSEPHFQFSDPYRKTLRIHTKHVATEEAT